MKKFLLIFIIIVSCSSSYTRSNEYYETVAGHVVQTILLGDCNAKCVSSIVSSDLKYATYAQAMGVVNKVGKLLPRIFDGVKRDLAIKVEEKYKKEIIR